jgi:hypothetical protein
MVYSTGLSGDLVWKDFCTGKLNFSFLSLTCFVSASAINRPQYHINLKLQQNQSPYRGHGESKNINSALRQKIHFVVHMLQAISTFFGSVSGDDLGKTIFKTPFDMDALMSSFCKATRQ